MNTEKLKEALVELKHQRALLDSAIVNLEDILSTLSGVAPIVTATGKIKSSESYIDLTVRILEEAGKPVHIAEIARKISTIRGKDIPRASVESSLLRHMKDNLKTRVVKVRPAYFGLPLWKSFAAHDPTMGRVVDFGGTVAK